MLIYILKFSACLAIFLGFYKLFLENENMHQFKRHYLIGAIFAAVSIPFVTFTQYVEPIVYENTLQTAQAVVSQNLNDSEILTTNYLLILLWSIYGLGVLLFGIKFLTNLSKIILKIKRNPQHKSRYSINVLLQDLVTPHTFFRYIFLNKQKYETQQIPQEVLLHEETHAKQKHSIDIILIEIFQVIFWFNPLIYLFKNSIKLNHEFLADKAVLQEGIQPSNYQQILLAFSTNQKEPQLANAINYSSIKKRITVMKTHTSKQKIWIRSLVLLPLLALLIFSFSSTKHIEKEIISESTDSHFTARSVEIKVLDNGTYEVDGIAATKKSFVSVINRLHQDITPQIRNQIINIHVNNGTTVSDEEVWFIYNSTLEYGFHRIVAYNQEIIRAKGNTPFAITSANTQKRTKVISKNTEEQKSATKEQIAEYNKLAKHYNSLSKDQLIIKQKDVERMKYIYGLMSAKQKKNAEPFPVLPPPPAPDAPKNIETDNILPPPPPPPLPENATPEQKKKYQKIIDEYEQMNNRKVHHAKTNDGENINIVADNDVLVLPPPPPPPIPDNATPEQKEKYNKVIEEYKRKHTVKEGRVYENPPPPPPPRSPLDHVIDMAKKDALFYLEGKEISSDDAIKALKENKSLNIETIGSSSKEPKVYITKKPVIIDN